jgi:hypothetical protein
MLTIMLKNRIAFTLVKLGDRSIDNILISLVTRREVKGLETFLLKGAERRAQSSGRRAQGGGRRAFSNLINTQLIPPSGGVCRK